MGSSHGAVSHAGCDVFLKHRASKHSECTGARFCIRNLGETAELPRHKTRSRLAIRANCQPWVDDPTQYCLSLLLRVSEMRPRVHRSDSRELPAQFPLAYS